VQRAAERIRDQVKFPPGYYIQWAGQFEYAKAAEKQRDIMVPFTLLIIFVLIFLNTQSVVKTVIVFLAVPFSLVGAFWLVYFLHYNMSNAVVVGLIALAGLDAETGVVMLLYLDHAWEKARARGGMATMGDLRAAVVEGAVQRIRPKIMTVCAILFGLLPIMWSPVTQAGADVMKRIATPMIGGVVTSAVLELLLYPVIYVLWRQGSLPKETRNQTGISLPTPGSPQMEEKQNRRHGFPRIFLLLLTLGVVSAGGYFAWNKFKPPSALSGITPGKVVASETVNGLAVTLSTSGGALRNTDNDVVIEFHDSDGKLVDVGTVKFELGMNMPGMEMHSSGTVISTGTPGRYRAKIKPDMRGDWTATISYQGPHGNGQAKFNTTIKP
jgi:hypothetical protein